MSPEQVYHSQNKICAAELSSRNMPSTSRLTPPHPHSACAQTTAALVWEPGQCPQGCGAAPIWHCRPVCPSEQRVQSETKLSAQEAKPAEDRTQQMILPGPLMDGKPLERND